MLPKVAIIILNWNGWKDTIECLESVLQNHYPNYQIILVDNGSHDKSIDKIKGYLTGKLAVSSPFFTFGTLNKPIIFNEYSRFDVEKKNIKGATEIRNDNNALVIIKNEKNFGFAEGNNIGIRFAFRSLNPDCILLLNNDTVIHPDCISDLVKLLYSDQKIGIAGALPHKYSVPEEPESLFMIYNPKRGNFKPIIVDSDLIIVDCVAGCSLIAKKEVFSTIGLLYSPFFLYYEEIDFCLRAKTNGFIVITKTEPKVWHKRDSSLQNVDTGNRIKMYFGTRNRIICSFRNGSSLDFMNFLLYFFTIVVIRTYFVAFRGKNISILKDFNKGIHDALQYMLKNSKKDIAD